MAARVQGEVYRARDTKLGREVAIKVLPEELSMDRERLSRFEREAKLLAALNHTNVATLYGLEESDGQQFLVMELVEGETLAERIARGPIPVDEALPLLIQIAEGVEAAHDKGIIHRDLKPANIKITPNGHIKILDFGLAKVFAPEDEVSAETSQSPTLTKGTALGAIMGTPAYMSPEQARGTPVDRRTDIWAFGCCLFEALTGRCAFEGEHVTDISALVMRAEPEWTALEQRTPPHFRRITEQCLRKDRKQRFQHIGDVRIALGQPIPVEVSSDRTDGRRLRVVPIVVTAVTTALVSAVISGVLDRRPTTEASPMELSIELPAGRRLWTRIDSPSLALTPDGSRLVFIGGSGASRQIFVRAMSERTVRPVAGTVGVEDTTLFVSPDGQWVGFYRDEKLWKTLVDGGIPVAILESREKVWGAHWPKNDTIVFGNGIPSPVYRVSVAGGAPKALTELDRTKGEHHGFPRMLPGGEALLFSVSIGNFESSHIEVVSLQSGERKRVLDDVYFVEYVPSGHLIYGRQETLFAVPFDVSRREVTGPATPVVTDVLMDRMEHRAPVFTVSESGTLVYAPRSEVIQNQLVWVNRYGEAERLEFEPGQFRGPRLSPDGSKLLVRSWNGSEVQIQIMDLRRNVAAPLATGGDSSSYPVWSPDGERIAFQSNRAGPYNMFSMPADGSGTPERLLEVPQLQQPYSWSPDGQFLLYADEAAGDERTNLFLLPMSSPGAEPYSWLSSEFGTHSPRFSPDGRFVAYVSKESGREEIYVSEFELGSDVRPRQKVSQSGGWEPVWSPNGAELYYRNVDGSALMVVAVQTEREIEISEPQKLFDTPRMPSPIYWGGFYYDVASDGRFLMVHETEERDSPMTLVVVLNWFEELERLAPTDN